MSECEHPPECTEDVDVYSFHCSACGEIIPYCGGMLPDPTDEPPKDTN